MEFQGVDLEYWSEGGVQPRQNGILSFLRGRGGGFSLSCDSVRPSVRPSVRVNTFREKTKAHQNAVEQEKAD